MIANGSKTHPSGNYEIKTTFPDEKMLGSTAKTFQVLVAQREPNCTTCLSFEPATGTSIIEFEKKLPYQFCEDFRPYLTSENGRYFSWSWLKLWSKVEKNRGDSRDAEVKAMTDKGVWELGVAEIYGLQKPLGDIIDCSDSPKQINVERGLNRQIKPGATSEQLNPALCPIANDRSIAMGGWYQIVAGKRRGKMVRCKAYDFYLDNIFQIKAFKRVERRGKKAVTKSYPFEDVGKATPDQIIDAYLADDLIELTEMDFSAFRNFVVATHESGFAKMQNKYLNRNTS